MEVNAQLKYAHIAPRKMRLVADMVRGKSAGEAELVLRHAVKRSSAPMLKLLKSAVANAVNNLQLDGSSLYVKDIKVNAGPVAKRMMPRAFGRGATIRKRTSHVALVLASRTETGRFATKAPRKKDQPVVRDADAEDLKIERRTEEKGGEKIQSQKGPKRSGRFTPRIFQRKAI